MTTTAIARAQRSHPPVFEDGFGKRFHVPGPGGEKLEVLALHESLTAVSSFEFSLRERVSAIAAFQLPAFARVRGVQRLGRDASALAIVSECPTGVRLSNVLAIAEQQLLPLDINAALYLIRQLAQALAVLHEQMHGISHCALAPERLVVAPHGRLVVVEHVLGSALEQLHLTHERYWKDFGVALPNTAGTPRFDQRTDVLQMGVVALSLVVGRRLYSEEFPDKIGPLAERAWGLTTAGGVEPLPAAVRTWLARALQLDARQSFASAVEARAELERAMGSGDHAAAVTGIRTLLAQYAKHAPAAPAAPPQPEAATPKPAKPPSAIVRPAPVAPPPPAAAPYAPPVVRSAQPQPDEGSGRSQLGPAEAGPDERVDTAVETASETVTHHTPWWRQRWIAAVVVLGVLGSAGAVAGRSYLTPPAVAEAVGTLIVESTPAGAAALVDGAPRGFTPLTLTLSPGKHVLEVVNGAERRTIPVTIAAGNTVSQFLDLPVAVAPSAGQLQVRTEPAGARVTVDGVARGQAPLTVDNLAPGSHTVVIANDLTSVTHDVVVEAGATASLVVPMTAPQGVPVSGWIAVAAPADLQVYERDRLLGTSRSDRIMVAVGRHELELVNEPLGFRATRVINVAPGQVAPIKVEWPNGSMALNAQPWAEVWIDGERVGETPIGNLAVPIGPHEVLFRHPDLGEHVVRTTVTLTTPTRLSVDLRKR